LREPNLPLYWKNTGLSLYVLQFRIFLMFQNLNS
jgi:hypothetical protein